MERSTSQPDPDRPILRVHGYAVMGGVSVETRLPGESERESHRLHRRELRGESVARKKLPAHED